MLTAILAMFANIYIFKARKEIKSSTLSSFIEACCIWMLFLFAITELLSVFHTVRFIALLAAWVSLDIVLLLGLVVQFRTYGYKIGDLCGKYKKVSTLKEYSYYGILFLIGVIVLLLAVCTTPYNWDSMTYHLPRIVYWAQSRSVEHYATNSIRQIASPMLGEFVNLHVYILSRGRDTLVNMLQAGSYITCAFLVGAIAGKLGCDRIFRFIAALIYMTMPIAFAEALTTQVDNFATVWLLFYVYVLLELVQQKENLEFKRDAIVKVCTLGLCVAWGYLAKPSVCIAMVIFAVWLLCRCIVRKDRVRALFALVCCALPCVVLPLAPEIFRNFRTFHAYASNSTGARQLVGTLQPSYLFVNFVKNFTFNFPTVLISDSHNFFIKIAGKAAKILSVDLNAESISEDGREFILHEANTYGCDTAINSIVMWLAFFCILWALVTIRKTVREGIISGYLLASTISFCIFCTFLRWEPFVTRYMVSYLALLCPMVTSQIHLHTAAEKRRPYRYAFIGVVSFLCVMKAISITVYHYDIYAHRGANNRPYGYFTDRRSEAGYYAEITDEIKSKGYKSVGLYLISGDDYEYPIWKMLNGQRIKHINVQNESAIYTDWDFIPECIIWFGALPEGTIAVNDEVYTQIKDFGENHYLLSK